MPGDPIKTSAGLWNLNSFILYVIYMLYYTCWSFYNCHILLIGNNSKCRNCCSWFAYSAVKTAEPRSSLPFWGGFYNDTASIYNSIISYNNFTIKLRVVSLKIKYLGMAVTLKWFDIENIKQCLFLVYQFHLNPLQVFCFMLADIFIF